MVVNDLGTSGSGEGSASEVAHEVVAEIEALGGEAVANGADVADFEQAAAMVQQAIDTFGGLDILVNNAGFVRDRMLVNTSEEEWDAVIRVHLKGHFAPLRHAGAWWRSESKEGRQRGRPGDQHLVRCGDAGLDRPDDVLRGQGRHRRDDAGRGGRARSLRRQRQRDRAGRAHPDDRGRVPRDDGAREGGPDAFDAMDPANNSPVVAWLASEDCDISGRVLEIEGGQICVEEGWRHGPQQDIGRRWEAGEVGAAVRELIGQAAVPDPVYGT